VQHIIQMPRPAGARKKMRWLGLALGSALLLCNGAPTASAQIYASAFDGVDTNFFFAVHPDEAGGGQATGFGYTLVDNVPGANYYLGFKAMTGVDGQLKGTSISEIGNSNYFFDVTPRTPYGGSVSNLGFVSENLNGPPLVEPVETMAVHAGQLVATSWSGSFNYFFELGDTPQGYGANANFFGGVTLGEGGNLFTHAIDTMAEYQGQLYGTAFDGTETLFFRINRNSGAQGGAWIDGLGAMNIGANGFPDPDRIDAMVGTDDGLYATSWNDKGQFNYLFRVTPEESGIGGYETYAGALTFDGAEIPYRINTLGYLSPVAAGPGGVPEPASWAMVLIGFGLTGAAVRKNAWQLRGIQARIPASV
jgi:hypothetical protein